MVTTVTTVTTVTAIAALGFTTAIGITMVITLLIFLTSRELASASQSKVSWRIARFASVGVLPLIIAFAAVVALKISELL